VDLDFEIPNSNYRDIQVNVPNYPTLNIIPQSRDTFRPIFVKDREVIFELFNVIGNNLLNFC
jgi:hypothetical protein